MNAKHALFFLVLGAVPVAIALGACSPDGTYHGGGRQLDPTGNGTLQVQDSGADSGPADSGAKDSGADSGPADTGAG